METSMMAQHSKIERLVANMEKVMIGKREAVELTVVALLTEGHVLLEDVPGVGKTMLVRSLAKSLDLDFKRIQFTPDLLPSDVTGMSVYNQKEMTFEFRAGPIFGNIVLADEINRTSPKTQSALLESMEERNITVDGNTMALKRPFFVMATQNPIEYEGTYALPEAQLDRFLLKLQLGYPTLQEEVEMLDRTSAVHPVDQIEAVMTKEEVIDLQQEVKHTHLSQHVKEYIVKIIHQTRNHSMLDLGASPRASIALMRASKGYAFLQGRDYVIPDDVKQMAPHVLSHRLLVSSEARFEGRTVTSIVNEVINQTMVPMDRG